MIQWLRCPKYPGKQTKKGRAAPLSSVSDCGFVASRANTVAPVTVSGSFGERLHLLVAAPVDESTPCSGLVDSLGILLPPQNMGFVALEFRAPEAQALGIGAGGIRPVYGRFRAWLDRLSGKITVPEPAQSRAGVPPDLFVAAIGDIHGRVDLLESLWQQIKAQAQKSDCRHRTLVFLGDYVDRGPDSARVVSRLIAGFEGFETICLKGNHEEAMLQFLSDPKVGPMWETFGGVPTLQSYGVAHAPGSNWLETRASFAMTLPEAHLSFFKNLRLHHVIGDYLFVHAGVRPHVALEDQTESDLLWIREAFLESDASFGRVVVHGHTPTNAPVERANRIGIDTGAYFSGNLSALILEGRTRRFLTTGQ